jgi:biopolymer transport protein ExbD
VIDAAGVLLLHGDPVADVSERMADMKSEDGTIRLLPSKDLPAAELLGLISHLKTAGAGQIVIVTEDASG